MQRLAWRRGVTRREAAAGSAAAGRPTPVARDVRMAGSGGLDVVVDVEDVAGVPVVFDLLQPGPGGRVVGGFHPAGVVAGEEVEVPTGGERFDPGPDVPRPGDVRVVVGGVGAGPDDVDYIAGVPVPDRAAGVAADRAAQLVEVDLVEQGHHPGGGVDHRLP